MVHTQKIKMENTNKHTEKVKKINNQIVNIMVNTENLQLPYVILSNNEKIAVNSMVLREVYAYSEINEIIGKEYNKDIIYNTYKTHALKEVIPLLINAINELKKSGITKGFYSKLSLKDKGYYEIAKTYNLMESIK